MSHFFFLHPCKWSYNNPTYKLLTLTGGLQKALRKKSPGGSVSQVLHREGPMPESLIACYAAQLLEVEVTNGKRG